MNRQLKLRRHLFEIFSFFQQCLREIVRPISQFLQSIDALLPAQFFLFVTQRKADELDLPPLFAFEFGLVRFIVFSNVIVSRFDVLGEIGCAQSDDAHEKFAVSFVVICLALAFRERRTRRDELFDSVQAKLITHQLLDLLFAKTVRCKKVLREVVVFLKIETGQAAKCFQIADHIRNLR